MPFVYKPWNNDGGKTDYDWRNICFKRRANVCTLYIQYSSFDKLQFSFVQRHQCFFSKSLDSWPTINSQLIIIQTLLKTTGLNLSLTCLLFIFVSNSSWRRIRNNGEIEGCSDCCLKIWCFPWMGFISTPILYILQPLWHKQTKINRKKNNRKLQKKNAMESASLFKPRTH